MVFREYRRTAIAEMYPWKKGYSKDGISISVEDVKAGSPKVGDMIARNPKNHKDLWLVAEKYFNDNFASFVNEEPGSKSLGNIDINGAKKNVKDIVVFGDGDLFKLISKASSKKEGWMKSTKAMEVTTGCLIQVTTQQGDNVAEALCFVPGLRIEGEGEGRKLL